MDSILIGQSLAMQRLRERIAQVAPLDIPVSTNRTDGRRGKSSSRARCSGQRPSRRIR